MDFENNQYVIADISGREDVVKEVVESFVESVIGDDVEVQRMRLPIVRTAVGDAVSFVVKQIPDRVDGYVIQPILEQVVDEKIAELPVEEGE